VLEPCRVMAWKDYAFALISYAVRGTLIVMLNLRFSQRCCQLFESPWMLRCVVGYMYIDVDRSAFICRFRQPKKTA